MNKQIYEYQASIGYRFIPNLQTRIPHETGGYLLKTNSLGFRSDKEFQINKTPGKKRILLFGDSFTAGDGVSNKYRFSDVLMNLNPELELFNFGIPGTGTDQHYIAYREYAKDIERDMVIIVVFVENIKRVNARFRTYFDEHGVKKIFEKPYFDFEKGKLNLIGIPVNPTPIKQTELDQEKKKNLYSGGKFHFFKKIITNLGLKTFFQKIMKYDVLFEYRKSDTKEWQLMKAVMLQWASEVKEPVLIVPMPLWQHVEGFLEFNKILARFNEMQGVNGIDIFNPLPYLQEFTPEEKRKFRFKIDVHFTPFGHEVYAKTLLQPIVKTLNK